MKTQRTRSARTAALLLASSMLVLQACGPLPEEPADVGPASASSELGSEEAFGKLNFNIGSALGSPVITSNTCGALNQRTPTCAYSAASDHTYDWTAPFTGSFTFTTKGAAFDTVLHIYNLNSPTPLGCNDDSAGTLQSAITLSLGAGQQLSIIVDGFSTGCGNFPLNISGTPSTPLKKAMTWSLLASAGTPGSGHAYALPGTDATTNPYLGDTFTNQVLPMLCLSKNGVPHPGLSMIGYPVQTPGGAWRRTWSSSTLALTAPLPGTSLTSRAVANALCAAQFGSGFRMAEFHDGDPYLWSGWDFWGEARGANLAPFQNTRFWVAINDQNSNPW